jgi:folate-dependent phosphoribosylglycinamide formyltransferase PurN
MWNLHPSLLPAFKGSDAIQQALDAGVPETGSTLHEVTADLDGGPILAQVHVPILAGDTLATLTARVKQAEQQMLLTALTQKSTAAS